MGTANRGSFVKGDERINRGGRPKKPENTAEKGKAAWDQACAMLDDPDLRPDLRFQVIKFITEFAFGKPAQAVDVVADVEANTNVSMIETMSLSKRGAAMKKALEVYEKGNQAKAK